MVTDLSELNLSAVRITASNNKIMTKNRIEEHLNYLPENSTSIVIEGANQNFGAYEVVLILISLTTDRFL